MADHPFSGIDFHALIEQPIPELDRVMQHGATPTATQLAGFEFRGYNPPTFARVLGFQKFMKGFFVDEDGKLAGYNVVVKNVRGGPHAPWEPSRPGTAGRHGYYDVQPVSPGDRYDAFENAVLLNYGSGRNFVLNPEGRIRDYLVQVDPENPDLFLGKAYIELGLFRVFSNFFILDRERPAPR
ncbi:MAG: hypothetical protein EP330_24005 [Deltaproteobacteria bacterium]|nr:MAG: hypothetical protein EP330_24005 [Deltaproteobacteria bacterium]